MVRETLRQVVLRGLTGRPLSALHRLLTRNAATIFMLHRFADPELGVEGHDISVLRRFLGWLRRRGVPLISVEDLVRRYRKREPLEGSVCFTVDDGYADFVRVGMPVFSEFECPVTVFLPTGFLDGDGWMWWDEIRHMVEKSAVQEVSLPFLEDGDEGPDSYSAIHRWGSRRLRRRCTVEMRRMRRDDRERALSRLAEVLEVTRPRAEQRGRFRSLTWDEARECASRGAAFGPHTRTHPWLSALSRTDARAEIEGSWKRLQEELDRPTPVFCYPYGEPASFGRREEKIVRDCGLEAAVSTVPAMVTCPGDGGVNGSVYRLPRFGFPDDVLGARQIATGIVRLRG